MSFKARLDNLEGDKLAPIALELNITLIKRLECWFMISKSLLFNDRILNRKLNNSARVNIFKKEENHGNKS